MKIAYTFRFADMRGGGERFVKETASRMQNLGHDRH